MTDITNEEFAERFQDIRNHTPKPGQVIASYRAKAELIEGNEKRNLMDLLFMPDKVLPAVQVMNTIFCAIEEDAVRVPMEMAEDLQKLSYDEVLRKPYSYTLELLYYTYPEHIPTDDPHWTNISVLNLDQLCTIDGIESHVLWEKKDVSKENEADELREDEGDLHST